MKKAVSMVLALIMVFSVTVTAFGAEVPLSLGEKKKVTIKGDNEKTYSFQAPESGIYKLDAKLLNNGLSRIELAQNATYIASGCLLSASKETDEAFEIFEDMSLSAKITDKRCELYFGAQKNAVITITLDNYGGWLYESDVFGQENMGIDKNAKVEFTVTKADVPTIKLGENTVPKQGGLFLFIPKKSGKYNFRSTAEKGIDPNIEIEDTAGNFDFNDSNGYSNDANFDLTTDMKKGRVYLISCYNNAEQKNKETKEYCFTVSYNKDIAVERIALENYEDEIEGSLILFVEDEEAYDLKIVPTGALPFADVSATIEDEKIAAVKIVEKYNALYLLAKKAGKTTLTVTDAGGTSTQYKLVVLPKSLSFLRNIIELLQTFFSGFFALTRSLSGKN